MLVPLPTLLGLREDTGELIGYGDLPAGVARELAADADWQRWVHDPVTGHLLDQGGYDYRVKAVLRTVPGRPGPVLPVPRLGTHSRDQRP